MKRDELIEQAVAEARRVIWRQQKSLKTERSYLGWLRRYIPFLFSLDPALPSEKKLEAFLDELARRDVAADTQNSAFHALRWFYEDVRGQKLKDVDALRATRGERLRRAPSVEDTLRLLADVRDVGGYPTNLVTRILYECGMRLCEPLNLRTGNLDIANSRVTIIAGKGRKDRVMHLPCSLALELEQQLVVAKSVWERDVRNGIPVELPHHLARKYPELRFAWQEAWVFPSHKPCRHPRTGETVRYRMHEANVQRAVKESRRRLNVMILPHELRHGYATHLLDRGINLKALQEAMGHKHIETTAGYCHADALSVPSPLEIHTAK